MSGRLTFSLGAALSAALVAQVPALASVETSTRPVDPLPPPALVVVGGETWTPGNRRARRERGTR